MAANFGLILPSPRAIDWRRASHSACQAGTRLTIMALIAPIRQRPTGQDAAERTGHRRHLYLAILAQVLSAILGYIYRIDAIICRSPYCAWVMFEDPQTSGRAPWRHMPSDFQSAPYRRL